MFIGNFNHTLDEKNRVAFPARFRAQLESGVVMTAGLSAHVLVYPRAGFEQLAEKIDRLNQFDPEAATLRRQIYMDASEADLDKQGRVILPEALRAHAAIARDAVIVGVGRFIEIWSPANWAQARTAVQDAAAQAHVWAKLGI
jgi:MraZ protein